MADEDDSASGTAASSSRPPSPRGQWWPARAPTQQLSPASVETEAAEIELVERSVSPPAAPRAMPVFMFMRSTKGAGPDAPAWRGELGQAGDP